MHCAQRIYCFLALHSTWYDKKSFCHLTTFQVRPVRKEGATPGRDVVYRVYVYVLKFCDNQSEAVKRFTVLQQHVFCLT